MNEIRTYGTLYGSKVFGGYVNGVSDLDFLISYKDLDENSEIKRMVDCGSTETFYSEGSMKNCEEFVSFKSFNDMETPPINLVVFSDIELLESYKEATKVMIAMKEIPSIENIIKNKEKRIQLFQYLVNLLDTRNPLTLSPTKPPTTYPDDDIPF